jgi:hypothetical protein
MLFSRIVPTVKDLGLFGDKVQKAFLDMGVIDYASVNPDDLSAADEEIADEMERRNQLQSSQGSRNGHGNGLSDVDPERAAEVATTIEAGR